MAISRDDEFSLGCHGGRDHMIIVGIRDYDPGRRERRYDIDSIDIIRNYLRGGQANESETRGRNWAKQHLGEFIDERGAREELCLSTRSSGLQKAVGQPPP